MKLNPGKRPNPGRKNKVDAFPGAEILKCTKRGFPAVCCWYKEKGPRIFCRGPLFLGVFKWFSMDKKVYNTIR